MPKIEYIPKNFRSDTLQLIEMANTVIEDYQARGYELTLRQLYYQLVARDLFPDDRMYSYNEKTRKWYKDLVNGTKNAEPNYIWLGTNIANARDAGLVDWRAIVDRTRSRKGLSTWNDPGDIIRSAYRSFRIDKWKNQAYRLFVWVEKEALAGVIARACNDEDIQVDYISCRGYMSASTIWREAQNIRRIYDFDQTPIIIHLGDHDPSGIDMTRDNLERLQLYSGLTFEFDLERIALNMDQIEQYNPPPNFAKQTDTRFGQYAELYGENSWELDALDPDILVNLIQDTIATYKDENLWQEMLEIEREYKGKLKYVYQNWENIGNGNN